MLCYARMTIRDETVAEGVCVCKKVILLISITKVLTSSRLPSVVTEPLYEGTFLASFVCLAASHVSHVSLRFPCIASIACLECFAQHQWRPKQSQIPNTFITMRNPCTINMSLHAMNFQTSSACHLLIFGCLMGFSLYRLAPYLKSC